MGYLVLQIVFFLLLAIAVGFVAGWLMRGWGLDGATHMSDGYERERRASLTSELNDTRAERDKLRAQLHQLRGQSMAKTDLAGDSSPQEPAKTAQSSARDANKQSSAEHPITNTSSVAPSAVGVRSRLEQGSDDLKQIKGIGPKLEKTLHELGITQFTQIAAWSSEEIAVVNEKLRFSGRIERDGWLEQAKALAQS